MKKYIPWIMFITFIIFIIDWGIVGLKLLDGNYDITVGAYIGLACFIIIFICILYRLFNNKCPNCGKTLLSDGTYCPYCGKKL